MRSLHSLVLFVGFMILHFATALASPAAEDAAPTEPPVRAAMRLSIAPDGDSDTGSTATLVIGNDFIHGALWGELLGQVSQRIGLIPYYENWQFPDLPFSPNICFTIEDDNTGHDGLGGLIPFGIAVAHFTGNQFDALLYASPDATYRIHLTIMDDRKISGVGQWSGPGPNDKFEGGIEGVLIDAYSVGDCIKHAADMKANQPLHRDALPPAGHR